MKKATVLEQVSTPDGSVQALVVRDGHYMIWVNGRELMSTRHAFSEEQLGVIGCAHLGAQPRARVLVGGLGLGFTLRAALGSLGRDARVLVAELMPDVVEWNKNRAYPLASAALADRRTEVFVGDVAQVIAESAARFDAILLDADNETTTMNTRGNSSLYRSAGIAQVLRALRPKGRVVYWSVGEDPGLLRSLRRAGFSVETERVAQHPTSRGGGRHVLIVGSGPSRRESAQERATPGRTREMDASFPCAGPRRLVGRPLPGWAKAQYQGWQARAARGGKGQRHSRSSPCAHSET
jgi:spermidine synthase